MSAHELVDVPVKPDVFWQNDFRRPDARLAGARCTRCAEGFFPPRRVCPRCHDAASIVAGPLATRGRVFALTHVTRPADPYTAPYLLALVDLDDGVRVLTQLAAAADTVRLGDEVTLVVEPLFELEGQRVWGYRFAPQPATGR